MTVRKEIDAAVAELKKTRQGYLKSNGDPRPLVGAQWKKGLDLLAQIGVVVAPPPPPPPAAGNLPAIITAGGTYSGTRTGTVQIRTPQPVVIQDSTITVTGSDSAIDANSPGAQVTLRRSTINGDRGRCLISYGFKSITVESCTIFKTTGIRLDNAAPGASILVTRNRVKNIQSSHFPWPGMPPAYHTVFFQTAHVTTATSFEVSWNEVVNLWGQSGVEDNINVFASNGAKIHNNYIQGSFPWKNNPLNPAGGHSGSGIMTGDAAGGNHEVYGNIVVGTTNCGIGIAGGHDIWIHDNRAVCWGKLPDGTALSATNVGVVIFGTTVNCRATDNAVAWLRPNGVRADTWFTGGGVISGTVALPTPTYASEQAEYQRWQSKLTTAGIKVGA